MSRPYVDAELQHEVAAVYVRPLAIVEKISSR